MDWIKWQEWSNGTRVGFNPPRVIGICDSLIIVKIVGMEEWFLFPSSENEALQSIGDIHPHQWEIIVMELCVIDSIDYGMVIVKMAFLHPTHPPHHIF